MTDILVITSTRHMGSVVNSLGSGKHFGYDFTNRVTSPHLTAPEVIAGLREPMPPT